MDCAILLLLPQNYHRDVTLALQRYYKWIKQKLLVRISILHKAANHISGPTETVLGTNVVLRKPMWCWEPNVVLRNPMCAEEPNVGVGFIPILQGQDPSGSPKRPL